MLAVWFCHGCPIRRAPIDSEEYGDRAIPAPRYRGCRVQHRLDDRLTAGQRVAHHDTTGRGRELLGIVAVDEGYIALRSWVLMGG